MFRNITILNDVGPQVYASGCSYDGTFKVLFQSYPDGGKPGVGQSLGAATSTSGIFRKGIIICTKPSDGLCHGMKKCYRRILN